MKRHLAPFALAAAIGMGGPAAALTQAEMDRFLEVAAEVGCVINPQTAALIEQRTGFSEALLGEIIQFLIQNNGVRAVNASQVNVTAGPCAG